jgi:hypothetical protein
MELTKNFVTYNIHWDILFGIYQTILCEFALALLQQAAFSRSSLNDIGNYVSKQWHDGKILLDQKNRKGTVTQIYYLTHIAVAAY